MKKHLAKALRCAANRLDPQPERWVALWPSDYQTSVANTSNATWTWREVAGR